MKKFRYAIFTCAIALLPGVVLAEAADAGHGKDYRTFHADGEIEYGSVDDSYTADLVMYLAGNQFMVMEELVADFQKKNPDIETVYVETIPPGQILKNQLLKQGQIEGQKTAMNPDIFASVNIGHLKKLKGEGLMDKHAIYIHNKLELMVAAGNPKAISGPEEPDRIEKGEADVGIVWTTEVVHAKAEGRPVEGVAIPAPLNKQDKVNYAIGIMKNGRNADNAARYLEYLASDDAQGIYESYGFLRASDEELSLKPL
jgi:ABC-type molybdate transport system substrate-binding protein